MDGPVHVEPQGVAGPADILVAASLETRSQKQPTEPLPNTDLTETVTDSKRALMF